MDIEPNWVLQFRDLPEIPTIKRWHGNHTLEQQVLMKMTLGQKITTEEESIILEAIDFYKSVIPKLKNIDFSTFNQEDYIEFKGYFNYIFNFVLLVGNEVTCWNEFRIVKNEDVLKQRKSIPNVSYLKYPPIEVVRTINKYGRANTPDFNLFYGAPSINAALLETKPQKGDLITIGIWANKNPEKTIFSFPITHSRLANDANPEVRKGKEALDKNRGNSNPLLINFLETVFEFLGDEFSKPVTSHIQYFYSAIYSERIFQNRELDWNYEAIIYPSVQNKYKYENLAVRPDVIDQYFHISRIYEIIVAETYYEEEKEYENILSISYIKPQYVKEPKQLYPDGTIIW